MYRKKILVVGGTGFIGFHLIKKLKKKKFSITSLSLNKVKKINRINKIKYIFCDISKKIQLKKKIQSEYDYIVNLGGNVDHSNKKETFQSHYIGSKNLIDIFKKKNIQKFIQIGSSTEYGFEKSPQKEEKNRKKRKLKSIYSRSKLKTTNYAISLYQKHKFPITVVRIFLAYGPRQKLDRLIPYVIQSGLMNLNFHCSAGEQVRDYIYIDDVVNFIILLLKNKKTNGEILNLGRGVPVKINFVINEIIRQIKKGKPIFGSIKLRKDEPEKLYADLNKAKKFLNWYPKINLKNGIKKTIRYYEDNFKKTNR
tara:strand:- start:438 stop:1367 length:930 start_codon:yes stop_codon:yes gene_type:complete